MNNIPKYDFYKVPDGYFETLPDRIMHTKKAKARKVLIYRMASAAVLAVGLTFFVVKFAFVNDLTLQAEMDQEVEFYINSGYWDADDVISFSENPDELLDRIIAEEWSGYTITDDQLPVEDLEY